MVLASEYLPTLQIILICCVLAPIHWPWGSVATQPSVVLAIRPFLGWQDGFGCWISVTVLDTLSQIQAAIHIFRLYLSNLCDLGGTSQLEILQVGAWRFPHAEQRRELIHSSAELQ